jgi:hypothetical protein
MASEREALLLDALRELGAWPYEQLKALRKERLSREVDLKDGQQATIHAEALEEFVEDGVSQILIPIEIWVGKDVIWAHLIGRSDGGHKIDMAIHTNPK